MKLIAVISTFFSQFPKLKPGVPFSIAKQDTPLALPGAVLHMTRYKSVLPAPLIKD